MFLSCIKNLFVPGKNSVFDANLAMFLSYINKKTCLSQEKNSNNVIIPRL